jgi:hypothetical protein
LDACPKVRAFSLSPTQWPTLDKLVVAQVERIDTRHNRNMAIVPLEVSRGPWWVSVEEDGYRLKPFRGDMLVIVWD